MAGYNKKLIYYSIGIILRFFRVLLFVPSGVCKFQPSCSEYAVEAFSKKKWWKAIFLITLRVLRCTPFSKGGFDPVP